MPDASPAFSINGNSPLAKASVSAVSTVTAVLDSLAGVRGVEWSIASTDETNTASSYTLATSGLYGSTVTFTSLTAGTAGILKCRVNGGFNSKGAQDPSMTATAKFFVATAASLEVGASGETTESDATHGSTGEINAALRIAGTAALPGFQSHGVSVTARPFINAAAPMRAVDNSGNNRTDISTDAATSTTSGLQSAPHWTKTDTSPLNAKAAPYNATGNGTTDDTAALNALFVDAYALQRNVVIPPGTYLITSTVLIFGLAYQRVHADGALIVWAGSFDPTCVNPIAAIWICSCAFTTFSHLRVVMTAGQLGLRLNEGIRIGADFTKTGAIQSTHNTFDRCVVDGFTGQIETAIRIGGQIYSDGSGYGGNNDLHHFVNCSFTGYANAGVEVQDSQNFSELFTDCQFASMDTEVLVSATTDISVDPQKNKKVFCVSGNLPWTSADIGSPVSIPGAGLGGVPWTGTIQSVTANYAVLDTFCFTPISNVVLPTCASMTSAASTFVAIGHGVILACDVGKYIEIVGAGYALPLQGTTGRLRCKVVSISGKTITVDTPAGTTLSSAARIYMGGQCAIRGGALIDGGRGQSGSGPIVNPGVNQSGTFLVHGGYSADHLNAAFLPNSITVNEIFNLADEGSRCFLRSIGTARWAIRACRIAGLSGNPKFGQIEEDPYSIYLAPGGGVPYGLVEDTSIGDDYNALYNKIFSGYALSIKRSRVCSIYPAKDCFDGGYWPTFGEYVSHVYTPVVGTTTLTTLGGFAKPFSDPAGFFFNLVQTLNVTASADTTFVDDPTYYKQGLGEVNTAFLRQNLAQPVLYEFPASFRWEAGPPVIPKAPPVDGGTLSGAVCTISLRTCVNLGDYGYNTSNPSVEASYRITDTFKYKTSTDTTGGGTEPFGLIFPIRKSAMTKFRIEVTADDGTHFAVWPIAQVVYSRNSTTTITPIESHVGTATPVSTELADLVPSFPATGTGSAWRVRAIIDGTNHNIPILLTGMLANVTVRIRMVGVSA